MYGIYQGEKLIQKLTTDENGYARSGELEEGDYTIKELSASKGYIVDTKASQSHRKSRTELLLQT